MVVSPCSTVTPGIGPPAVGVIAPVNVPLPACAGAARAPSATSERNEVASLCRSCIVRPLRRKPQGRRRASAAATEETGPGLLRRGRVAAHAVHEQVEEAVRQLVGVAAR